MSSGVTCVCGKRFRWKPEWAGKTARCPCGQPVKFSLTAADESAPVPSPAISAPPITVAPKAGISTAPADPSSEQPPLVVRVGVLAGGLAAVGFFVILPIIQVRKGESQISVNFKGILLATMLTCVGLNLLLLPKRGIPWKRGPGSLPITMTQKVIIGITVGAGLVAAGLILLFFDSNGYSWKL